MKEKEKQLLIQIITLIISMFAVFASVFAGLMAYKSNIISTQLSSSLNKDNEIERRNWEEKRNVYIDLINILEELSEYDDPSGWTGYKNTQETLKNISNIDSKLKVFGSNKINVLTTCLINNSYILNGSKYYSDIDDGNLYVKWFGDKINPYYLMIIEELNYELSSEYNNEKENGNYNSDIQKYLDIRRYIDSNKITLENIKNGTKATLYIDPEKRIDEQIQLCENLINP